MNAKETFSNQLRKLRKEHKISQRELAKALNLSDVSVSRYELGTAEPSLETFHAICNYFNATPDYLFGHVDNPSEKAPILSSTEIEEQEQQTVETYKHLTPLTDLAIDVLDGKGVQQSDFCSVIRLLPNLNADELTVVDDVLSLMLKSKRNTKDTP